MSVAMKKLHIESKAIILRILYEGDIYDIPKINLDQYRVDKPTTKTCDGIFIDLERKNTKAGVLLQGTRNRDGLTQKEFAKKINILQSDLSKMECGKRPIGKIIAKRIEKTFGVSYKYFLE